MSTRRWLPIFVLAIGGLVVLGCGGQTEDRNRVGDATSYGAKGGTTQFMLVQSPAECRVVRIPGEPVNSGG